MTWRVVVWCALGLALARCVCACACGARPATRVPEAPVKAPPPAYGHRVV